MKILLLASCAGCPHRVTSGRFTDGGAYPVCLRTPAPRAQVEEVGMRLNFRILPWEPIVYGAHTTRQATEEIPDWCPLDDVPKSNEMLVSENSQLRDRVQLQHEQIERLQTAVAYAQDVSRRIVEEGL